MDTSSPPSGGKPPGPILPLHTLSADVLGPGSVRRRRGRPRKVRPAPTHDEREYHRQRGEERALQIQTDALVRAIEDGVAGFEIVRIAMLGLARETASLKWERQSAEREGRDAAPIASRRIDALGKLASLVLALRKVDPDPPISPVTFKKLVQLFVNEIGVGVHEVLPEEQATTLMKWFEQRVEVEFPILNRSFGSAAVSEDD